MDKKRLERIKEHFDYSIKNGLTMGERDGKLLSELYKTIEHYQSLLEENVDEYIKLEQENNRLKNESKGDIYE